MDHDSLPDFAEWKRELANLASIPEAQRPLFYENIIGLYEIVVGVWHYPKNTDAEVVAAAVAVRAAREAIAALSSKQAADLAHAMKLGPPRGARDMEALTLLELVDGAFGALTGRPLYEVARKRGKTRGTGPTGPID